MPRQITPEERARIKNEIVAKAPDGLTDEEFDRFFKPRMEQALGIAENTPAPLQGSSLARALSGIWDDVKAIPGGVYQAVTNPLDTATAMAQGHARTFQQMRDAPTLSEKIGYGWATSVPVVGPAAASIADEGVATGDYGRMVGRGLGMAAPTAAVPAARLTGRTALAVGRHLPGAGAVADAADAAATARMTRFIAPQVGPNKVRFGGMAEEVAPKLLREPDLSAMSQGSLATKVEQGLVEAGDALDAVADKRLVSQQIQTAPIVEQLDRLIGEKVSTPLEGSQFPAGRGPLNAYGQETVQTVTKREPIGAAVEAAPYADELATLRQIREEVARLGSTASYEAIRRIRAAWDRVAKVKYMPATAQDALRKMGSETAAMRATGVIRESLAGADPATAAANQRFSLYKSADDVLKALTEAERVRPTRGRGIMARSVGAVIGAGQGGPIGAGIGAYVANIVDHAAEFAPSLQVVIARRLAGVADALRKGQPQTAMDILGRLERQIKPMRTSAKAGVPAGSITVRGLEAGTPTIGAEDQPSPGERSVQR